MSGHSLAREVDVEPREASALAVPRHLPSSSQFTSVIADLCFFQLLRCTESMCPPRPTSNNYLHPLHSSLPEDLSIPNCTDVCNEWQVNPIDPDLQMHILTALNGAKLTIVPLRRLLDALKVPYERSDSFGQLREKLREYINLLRKGKKVEHSQEEHICLNGTPGVDIGGVGHMALRCGKGIDVVGGGTQYSVPKNKRA
ncbi:hypothetical protein B0H11DRAFT_1932170 [Mycena galericulata]|nr:hypothetical protein B0H11DRAFT_1932170 [Mycena galericulata]